VYDIASRTPTRLTSSGKALQPTWTPDGRIAYMMAGRRGIVLQPIDGSPADTLPGTEGAFAPTVTPDGQFVVFHVGKGQTGAADLLSTPLSGVGGRRALVSNASANANMPALSPDGRWLAYTSNETGHNEVYVRSFPGLGRVVQVSDGSGGTEPAWSPDGRRIYYRGNGKFMAATIHTSTLAITSRVPQFNDKSDNTMPHRDYDVSPDGKGFLMIAPSVSGGPEAVVKLNWLIKLREQLAIQR
jgi:Tol biopolymer transport system component